MTRLTRRRFVQGSAAAALLASMPGASFAQGLGDTRLVVMILRGALDGLQAVPALGDPDFAAARGLLAGADFANGAHRLDDLFSLHPALANLHSLYGRQQLTVFHAVATPYRERSHFDAQDLLENGTAAARGARDGWLNRALVSARAHGNPEAIAFGQNVPLILRGAATVNTWAPSRMPGIGVDLIARLEMLYADDDLLARRLAEGLSAEELAGNAAGADGNAAGVRNPLRSLGATLQAVARFLVHPEGPRIAVLDSNGWDTHANESQLLTLRLRALDEAFLLLEQGLGPVWENTAVLVVTEFGRAVAINGSRGTDHGTGAAAFLFGGAVTGGRVIADWPGLRHQNLHEGRDLKATLDLRSVCKGLLAEAFAISDTALGNEVFPDSREAPALEGLLRS